MTTPATETPQQNTESYLYYISFSRLEELQRSPVAILADRRGPSCPSLMQPNHELNDPQKLLDEIAECCSGEQDYIKPDMPIQEIVFRILLTRRNQHMSVEDLHYELTEKWSTPIRPISMTVEGLHRILRHDTYYGFDFDVEEAQASKANTNRGKRGTTVRGT